MTKKICVLCGIALLASPLAFAQTSSDKMMTLSGCVGGVAESKVMTLSNPMVIPGTAQPGQIDRTPSTLPPTEASAAPAPVTPSNPSPTGTSGTTHTASGAVATSGIVATAPDASSPSSISGYRLSGEDMRPWMGQRVQVVGTFVPVAPQATAPTAGTGAASTLPILEFKVQTVHPMSGPCPK